MFLDFCASTGYKREDISTSLEQHGTLRQKKTQKLSLTSPSPQNQLMGVSWNEGTPKPPDLRSPQLPPPDKCFRNPPWEPAHPAAWSSAVPARLWPWELLKISCDTQLIHYDEWIQKNHWISLTSETWHVLGSGSDSNSCFPSFKYRTFANLAGHRIQCPRLPSACHQWGNHLWGACRCGTSGTKTCFKILRCQGLRRKGMVWGTIGYQRINHQGNDAVISCKSIL